MNPLLALVEDVLGVIPGDHKLMPDICKLIVFDKGAPISGRLPANIDLSPDLGRKLASVLEAGGDCGIDWLDNICKSDNSWVRKPFLLKNLEGTTSAQLATISLMNDASFWLEGETTFTGAYKRSVASEIADILSPSKLGCYKYVDSTCPETNLRNMNLSYQIPLKKVLLTPSPLCASTVKWMRECCYALARYLECAEGDDDTIKHCARIFKRNTPFKKYIIMILKNCHFNPQPKGIALLKELCRDSYVCYYSLRPGIENEMFRRNLLIMLEALQTIDERGGPDAVVEEASGRALQGMLEDDMRERVIAALKRKRTYIARNVDAGGHIHDFYRKVEAMGEDRRKRRRRRSNNTSEAVLKFQRRGNDRRNITYEVGGKQVHMPQFRVDWDDDAGTVSMPMLYMDRAIVSIHPVYAEGAQAEDAQAEGAQAKGAQAEDAVAVVGTCMLGEFACFSEAFDAVTRAAEDISANGASTLYGMCKAVSQCILCARELSNEKSIERGVGPVCAASFRGMRPFCPTAACERPAVDVKDLVSRLDPEGQSVISVLGDMLEDEKCVSEHVASRLMPGGVSGDDVLQALRDLDVMEQTCFEWTPPTGRRRVVALLLAHHIVDAKNHKVIESVSECSVKFPAALCMAGLLLGQ